MTSKGVVLVTGAAQGIGREIALRLADDGFDVAVNDIPSKATNLSLVLADIEAKGRKSSSHIADVTLEEQVKKMIDEVVTTHGALDVVVANAGVTKWVSLFDTSVEDWDRIMTVNGRGTFLCYKYAGMQMVAQGRGGRIIGASSIAGKTGFPFTSAYCASKFAVRGLTQAAAQEFGKHGITVNAYAPGMIDSEMLNSLAFASPKDTGASGEDWLETARKSSPLGRLGTATDISNLVSFIASKESQFITGQTISVNGGNYFD
ncbi:hypothetical protein C8R43DRAFT_1116500 [Mycena crocata]|nr:hypothetical protein C8R43DRAFT_1116500 [Mycena crocata]